MNIHIINTILYLAGALLFLKAGYPMIFIIGILATAFSIVGYFSTKES